jgi:hypothetical protein
MISNILFYGFGTYYIVGLSACFYAYFRVTNTKQEIEPTYIEMTETTKMTKITKIEN